MEQKNDHNHNEEEEEVLEVERYQALAQVESLLELPIMVLGVVWLILLIIDLISGLNPLLSSFVFIIWGLFVLDFLLRFIIAPDRLHFIRHNWLTLLSLALPMLRVFRLAYFLRVFPLITSAGTASLVSVLASFNRGMRLLRGTLRRRGFGYVVLLSLLVVLLGAAGMYAFEHRVASQENFTTYGEALWWTAMMVTTMGTGQWPQTAEGQTLALLISVYAFTIFGYVTATLATFFIGQEAESEDSEVSGKDEVAELKAQVGLLQARIEYLIDKVERE